MNDPRGSHSDEADDLQGACVTSTSDDRSTLCAIPLTNSERRKVLFVGVCLTVTMLALIAVAPMWLAHVYCEVIPRAWQQGRLRLLLGACGVLVFMPCTLVGLLIAGIAGAWQAWRSQRGRFSVWILRESSEEVARRRNEEYRHELQHDPEAEWTERVGSNYISTRAGIFILLIPLVLLLAVTLIGFLSNW